MPERVISHGPEVGARQNAIGLETDRFGQMHGHSPAVAGDHFELHAQLLQLADSFAYAGLGWIEEHQEAQEGEGGPSARL